MKFLFGYLIFYLGVSSTAGIAATLDVAPGASISEAVAKAEAGDIIRVAPGLYRESISVTKPGLTVTSATEPGGEPDVVVESPNAEALKDSRNTIWRGVSFRTMGDKPIADLSKFRGRVEYCRFDPGANSPGQVSVVAGGGVFHGTTFANQKEYGVRITGSPLFTYCRFENLAGAAVSVEKGEVRFQNCLFARNGFVLERRSTDVKAEIVNSIFFLNTADELVEGKAPFPVTVTNCVYTPSRNSYIEFRALGALEAMAGLELNNSRTASPRFVSSRRRGVINLGIDDNRCIPLWYRVTEEADKYRYPITIAAHAVLLSQENIEKLNQGHGRGHEIASHGYSHAPFNAAEGLKVGFHAPGTRSAHLNLGDDNVLRIYVDDKAIQEIPLGSLEDENPPNLSSVAEKLRQAGIRASTTDDSYRNIPAALLTKIPRLDIWLMNFETTLGIQTDEYMKFEAGASKKILEKRLNLQNGRIHALVYPYISFSRQIGYETKNAGYLCGRCGDNVRNNFYPGTDGLDPYSIYGANFRTLISAPDIEPDIMRETVFIILDFINDEGAMMSLYSHDENELTFDNWRVLLKAIHDDGLATPVTLQSLAETMTKQGEFRDGRYFLTFSDDLSDYRLRQDSPWRGAGIPLGLRHDFDGRELPPGNPSIGLYQ
jgi:hypothetical protein